MFCSDRRKGATKKIKGCGLSMELRGPINQLCVRGGDNCMGEALIITEHRAIIRTIGTE